MPIPTIETELGTVLTAAGGVLKLVFRLENAEGTVVQLFAREPMGPGFCYLLLNKRNIEELRSMLGAIDEAEAKARAMVAQLNDGDAKLKSAIDEITGQ